MKTKNAKAEIWIAVFWIVLYIVSSSLADGFSQDIGIAKVITCPWHIFLLCILLAWIRRSGQTEKYGLCRANISAKVFWYFIPLVIIASTSLWAGVKLRMSVLETVLHVISMLCVGFLEEVIFRGLLFRAMEKDGLVSALVVSSLTFGIGHIVNLFNGKALGETLLQILFAVIIGFILVMIFYKGGSLIPCIVFHSVNNALSAFRGELPLDPTVKLILDLVLILFLGGGYLYYLVKKVPWPTPVSAQPEQVGQKQGIR